MRPPCGQRSPAPVGGWSLESLRRVRAGPRASLEKLTREPGLKPRLRAHARHRRLLTGGVARSGLILRLRPGAKAPGPEAAATDPADPARFSGSSSRTGRTSGRRMSPSRAHPPARPFGTAAPIEGGVRDPSLDNAPWIQGLEGPGSMAGALSTHPQAFACGSIMPPSSSQAKPGCWMPSALAGRARRPPAGLTLPRRPRALRARGAPPPGPWRAQEPPWQLPKKVLFGHFGRFAAEMPLCGDQKKPASPAFY